MPNPVTSPIPHGTGPGRVLPISRRSLMIGASLLPFGTSAFAATRAMRRVEPIPARFVTLQPSPFVDAFAANRRYLLDLDPERLLHNFYISAGLTAPKPVYGGWEAQGIAGHSLGHWLSACALTVANTGDAAVAARLDHALKEMARIQTAHGDGYVGGTTVERDGRTVDGKIVFEELRRGDIRSNGFDLNGGWVPLYTWHKVHAGLIDAHVLARNPRAMPVLLGMAGYLAGVLEPRSDEQMQRILAAEHGGLNESYADTYALTGDARWLRMAEKIRHKAVLDPLTAGQDRLAGLHANTQIPKVIGLARLHELTGAPAHAAAARFFHQRVTGHHSYVIGGNSEREHFGQPDQLSKRLGEATCEACNSYNMLKLTRHLYGWQPEARWFDFYERVQINHMLAHQRPRDGRFVYFMPLAAGARRTYSSPEDSFWCCVGSGMESHAKHADSIWWQDADTLYLNLFVPSKLDWSERGLAVDLDTAMPLKGDATLTVRRAPRGRQAIAIRLPGWAKDPVVALNGQAIAPVVRGGYAVIDRRWRAGDTVALTLPMTLATEATPDDPTIVAFTYGPLVLAADMGSEAKPFDSTGPALVNDGAIADSLTPAGDNRFTATGALGETLTFRPFYSQWDRRTAVYLPTFTSDRWAAARGEYVRAQAEARTLGRRTVDTLYMGEMQPERDHQLVPGGSEVVNWSGRSARRIKPGQTLGMTLARRPGPAVLRLLIWGRDVDRAIDIALDGAPLATATHKGPAADRFVALDYPIPSAGAQGRPAATITLTAKQGDAVIYEVRMLTAEDAAPVTSV
ncbi:glycoside hydrolase family 127 protein [Sphingomonas sp. Leaf62]|uniref:glycoside hydrolase family 127 protein n=1 Tax=Sphingomonas sp. Leaf62 TaxID=1736228 RepID=UPI0009EC32F9|nr:glycoside hydrolase family 127 protein [Sphingomonas sp. Leaf62]